MAAYIKLEDVIDLARRGVIVGNSNYVSVCKAVKALPSIDIVFCKECKHRQMVKWANGTVHWECELDSADPYDQSRHAEDDDWFCGDGEARE